MSRQQQSLIPQAVKGLDTFKMEVAKEMNVPFTDGYNGNITSKDCGSVGGEMVKRMVQKYEETLR